MSLKEYQKNKNTKDNILIKLEKNSQMQIKVVKLKYRNSRNNIGLWAKLLS